MDKEYILEHHIHFLSKHRGIRKSHSEIEFIHSDKPSFNIAFLLSSEKISIINSSFSIYKPDWVSINKSKMLDWEKKGSITYMIFANSNFDLKNRREVEIRRALDISEIEEFSVVQGRGFCETKDDFDEWYPWMREKNIDNFGDTDQHFYIVYYKKKPVGVCLAIIKNCILGIYAVATLPEFRKLGVSTSLLKHIVENNSNSLVTLQVITNSYAHSFYQNRGFFDAFECSIFAPKH